MGSSGSQQNRLNPGRKARWCIPPKPDAAFVCAMEQGLTTDQRPLDPDDPMVCLEETRGSCGKAVRPVMPGKPGQVERDEVASERNGVAHLIGFQAPRVGWRRIDVADHPAAWQWAPGVRRWVEEDFLEAKRITRVMDHRNTHTGASRYQAFAPDKARALLDRLELVSTLKQGSWLNMAEGEFSVLSRPCFHRRIPDRATVEREVSAWTNAHNREAVTVNGRFTTDDARIKLKTLYPSLSQ